MQRVNDAAEMSDCVVEQVARGEQDQRQCVECGLA